MMKLNPPYELIAIIPTYKFPTTTPTLCHLKFNLNPSFFLPCFKLLGIVYVVLVIIFEQQWVHICIFYIN
jgi:hypothetical protein